MQSGQDGFLDVSRTTFKENTEDAYAYAVQLSGMSFSLQLGRLQLMIIRGTRHEA